MSAENELAEYAAELMEVSRSRPSGKCREGREWLIW